MRANASVASSARESKAAWGGTGVLGLLQRQCKCGSSEPNASGTCHDCASTHLQPRLAIDPAHDAYEQEADRVADAVVRSPSAARPVAGSISRAMQRELSSATSSGRTAGLHAAERQVDSVLATSGHPLDASTRAFFEPRFGHDFSRVRIHHDAAAGATARAVDAHAYTVGEHVVFGAGYYAPDSTAGRRLLAHELTHVVQQAGPGVPDVVQRGSFKDPTPKPHSCGGWNCAATTDCPNPDGKSAPTKAASTSWSLTANLDLDVSSAAAISGPSEIGHAFVEFKESNGDRYTYGHYPNKSATPDPIFRPKVGGCGVHPDQTHADCVDMRINYNLTKPQYDKALDFAKAWCGASVDYDVRTQNCTTFVELVAGVAGQSIPSSRGTVGSGTFSVKNADNPNTLFDTQVSQPDDAAWRQRASGGFTGHYDAGGAPINFTKFQLKTDDKFAVAGEYTYTGSSGDTVEGTLDGRMVFDTDPVAKTLRVTITFDWKEPSGTGRGLWTVDPAGAIKGTWGRGAAASGAGAWELAKKP